MIEHEPGMGQEAFAPRRRDMTQHRIDQERIKAASAQLQAAKAAKAADAAKAAEASTSASNLPDTDPVKAGTESAESAASAPTKSALLDRRPLQLNALRVAIPPAMRQASASAARPSAETDSAIADDDSDEEGKTDSAAPSPALLCSASCSSYFTEPLSWMSEQLESGSLGGKLICPTKRCGAKLGNFDWAGLQCSCGAWVTPAFAIAASKVDELAM